MLVTSIGVTVIHAARSWAVLPMPLFVLRSRKDSAHEGVAPRKLAQPAPRVPDLGSVHRIVVAAASDIPCASKLVIAVAWLCSQVAIIASRCGPLLRADVTVPVVVAAMVVKLASVGRLCFLGGD